MNGWGDSFGRFEIPRGYCGSRDTGRELQMSRVVEGLNVLVKVIDMIDLRSIFQTI